MVYATSAGLDDTDARRAFIREVASTTGTRWAERRRAELTLEGRRPVGGWPGTKREARGNVDRALGEALRARDLPGVTAGEREEAARVTNASARAAWLHGAEPDNE